jgi:hypothetical protein
MKRNRTKRNKTKRNRTKRNRTKRNKKGGGFFDYFTKHGREQMLINECKEKNDICQRTGNCDCTVGSGLQRLTSNVYCNKVEKNNKTSCETPKISKYGVEVDKSLFWYKYLIKPFSF